MLTHEELRALHRWKQAHYPDIYWHMFSSAEIHRLEFYRRLATPDRLTAQPPSRLSEWGVSVPLWVEHLVAREVLTARAEAMRQKAPWSPWFGSPVRVD
jgi:hypothetical protein